MAGVLEALLRQPTVRRRLARAAGLDDIDEGLVARLAFLAFIHDLGKCAPGFRAKAVPSLGRPAGHLATLKPLWCDGGPLLTELQRVFVELDMANWGSDTLADYFLAVFAHHGRTPDLHYDQGADSDLLKMWRAGDGEALRQLGKLLAAGRETFPDAFTADASALPGSPTAQHLFAGLLMLADWIGSGADWFPFANQNDPPRMGFVRSKAVPVLETIGFVPPTRPRPLPPFAQQFPFPPRLVQTAVDDLSLPDDTGSVVLLESETGSGKTEAALRWASRLIDAGLVDGCYFAVPLRSAAVQLHGRMQGWLDATHGGGAVEALLAVPGYFRMGIAEGSRLPDFAVQWSDDETTDRRSARWAAEQPKRYMAASFAVGTIDQALLGALAVKHAHLRSACLVRHLLVIDEVHSSDAYMTALVERLLTLFRATGGHVLLMSATVGAATRERLVHRLEKAPPLAVAVAVPYPRITASHTAAVDIEPEGPGKSVRIEPQSLMDDPAGVAAIAAEAITAGARVLVLRNTVTAAMATQEAIEALLPADDRAFLRVGEVVTLHHGRFAAEDRRLLDEAVEGRFGKKAPTGPALVVATQTLEQSLDVDADLLITDLCPIDVLLQRIGRLHRHEWRDRPAGFEEARCIVLLPAADDLSSFLQSARHGIGPERAYDNVLAVEATRRMVTEAPVWSIPADNRRLVEEGTHEERLRALARSLGSAWENHWHSYFGSKSAARNQARDVSIDFTVRFGDLRWPDSAEKIATRLGARDLLVKLDRPILSPFDATLTHLKVPAWMKPKSMPEGEPMFIVADDGMLALGDGRYRYDRFGLR